MTWAGKGAASRRGCALGSEGGEQRSQAQALAGTQAGDGAGWPQGLRAAVRKRAGLWRVGGRLGCVCALTVLSVPHPVRVRCGDGEQPQGHELDRQAALRDGLPLRLPGGVTVRGRALRHRATAPARGRRGGEALPADAASPRHEARRQQRTPALEAKLAAGQTAYTHSVRTRNVRSFRDGAEVCGIECSPPRSSSAAVSRFTQPACSAARSARHRRRRLPGCTASRRPRCSQACVHACPRRRV